MIYEFKLSIGESFCGLAIGCNLRLRLVFALNGLFLCFCLLIFAFFSHRVCRNPILPWHKLSPEKLAKAQLEREVVEVKRKKITTSRLQTSSAFSRPRGRGRPRLSLVTGKKFQSKLGSISGSGRVMSSVRRLQVPKASAGVDDNKASGLFIAPVFCFFCDCLNFFALEVAAYG